MTNGDILLHYGILGMKWGIRRTPEQLGHKTLKKAKTANLDKWGKSPETNILYVTGRSGSGKSTIARSMKDDKTDVIHLDLYFEVGDDSIEFDNEYRSRTFDQFLRSKKVDLPSKYKPGSKAFGENLTRFEKALDDFGKAQYQIGRKVIAEGIQIADSGLWMDKNYYKDKPIIIGQSSEFLSSVRAMYRDVGKMDIEYVKNRLKNSGWMNDYLSALESTTNANRGSDWVKQYLKEVSE